jgi:hypothetical protein
MIPPNEIRAKLDQIKGHLVWMPLDFLKDAPMAETGLQVNQFTESYVFIAHSNPALAVLHVIINVGIERLILHVSQNLHLKITSNS